MITFLKDAAKAIGFAFLAVYGGFFIGVIAYQISVFFQ